MKQKSVTPGYPQPLQGSHQLFLQILAGPALFTINFGSHREVFHSEISKDTLSFTVRCCGVDFFDSPGEAGFQKAPALFLFWRLATVSDSVSVLKGRGAKNQPASAG